MSIHLGATETRSRVVTVSSHDQSSQQDILGREPHRPALRACVCTHHSDGRIVRHPQTDLSSAVDALSTFLDTARSLGYRIDPQENVAKPRTRYVARQGAAWVMFWIDEIDEATRVG